MKGQPLSDFPEARPPPPAPRPREPASSRPPLPAAAAFGLPQKEVLSPPPRASPLTTRSLLHRPCPQAGTALCQALSKAGCCGGAFLEVRGASHWAPPPRGPHRFRYRPPALCARSRLRLPSPLSPPRPQLLNMYYSVMCDGASKSLLESMTTSCAPPVREGKCPAPCLPARPPAGRPPPPGLRSAAPPACPPLAPQGIPATCAAYTTVNLPPYTEPTDCSPITIPTDSTCGLSPGARSAAGRARGEGVLGSGGGLSGRWAKCARASDHDAVLCAGACAESPCQLLCQIANAA